MSHARLAQVLPGLLLSVAVAAVALAGERLEHALVGKGWVEGLVLAIVIGVGVNTALRLSPRFRPGIDFAAKTLLEIAIVLLGASISFATIGHAGPMLIGAVVAVVALSIGGGFVIGRLLGLPPRLAVLIACGNSICGNSAIVAVAPVIRARSEETAVALAFSALLGILVVLLLPLVPAFTSLTMPQYGVMAGLTVYAVPQVLAAAAPGGLLAIQAGTVVKLLRVLMLGPVIFALGMAAARNGKGDTQAERPRLVPWFILGFMIMVCARSFGYVPEALVAPVMSASDWLTVVAMAALGLSVDVTAIARAGGRAVLAASLSLLLLAIMSYVLITTVLAQAFA